jgi:hypothetical protein
MRRSNGEPPEVRIADTREVGRRNARAIMRRAYAHAVLVERIDDFGGQDGLELFSIGVLMPEVAKNISAARTTSSFSLFIATSPCVLMPCERKRRVSCDYATVASPFFSTSDSSLSEAPEGRFSPRSHLLTRLLVTFR